MEFLTGRRAALQLLTAAAFRRSRIDSRNSTAIANSLITGTHSALKDDGVCLSTRSTLTVFSELC
jgi:hypothetical protein